MEEMIARSVAPDRFSMLLLGALALIALALAAVGVYGLHPYFLSERPQESAIMMAGGGGWEVGWGAEVRCRELVLADWEKLNWRTKLGLLRRSLGAFWDALLLQPQRLEDEMFQDLHYGVRVLMKRPGLTLIAVFTLA